MISITFFVDTEEDGHVSGSSKGIESNFTTEEVVALALALKQKSESFLKDIPEEFLLGDIIVTETSGNA